MTTNASTAFSADVVAYIEKETLPLARRQLVVYQFGDPLRLPEGRGVVYTATRYNRIPLPASPLSEGVPPVGETMTISQVSVTALQWGDAIKLTDVAEITVFHPPFQEAIKLVALQIAETLERNCFNQLLGGTQINYVNSRGARASLVAGDVLDPHTVNRTWAALATLGAPRFMGDEQTDEKYDAAAGGKRASENPHLHPHYVAVCHTLVVSDFRENAQVSLAWSYSDVNRLYNAEIGEWSSIIFCMSNMVPFWTGIAQVNATNGTAGALPTGTYYIQVTGQDTQNQYESQIYQISTSVSVVGATGSISVTVPSTTGYTYNVYIAGPSSSGAASTTVPSNLGLSTAGPSSGPNQGQATQIAAGATATITAVGISQVPPAAPATGVTVYPTFVFGRGAYGQVVLKDVEYSWLTGADKSDYLNQLRVIGYKFFQNTLIQNNMFFARIESASGFSAAFG